jgi:hypothetical protein
MAKFATRDRSIAASAGDQINLKKSHWGLLSAKKFHQPVKVRI